MYDNVQNVKITYHIKKKRILTYTGFLRKYLSLYISYVTMMVNVLLLTSLHYCDCH
jgi:hypothetical protein